MPCYSTKIADPCAAKHTFCSYLAIFGVFFLLPCFFFALPSSHCLFDSYHRRKWFCSLRCIVDDAFCIGAKQKKKHHLYVYYDWASHLNARTERNVFVWGVVFLQCTRKKGKQNRLTREKTTRAYTHANGRGKKWNMHFKCSKLRHQAKEMYFCGVV